MPEVGGLRALYTFDTLVADFGKSAEFYRQLVRDNKLAVWRYLGRTPLIRGADLLTYLESLPETD